ncbi:DUF1330 domain-containing protein [Porticoccus sp.]|uniref:DUF1330 domain-containing protein n=1 Tax=Porticoccus sp. TaxID=2024853 RepID=UPI003F69BD19
MAVYLIADVTVTDEAWIPNYATSVHDIVHKHGGKYLSRSANISTVEGTPCNADMIALVEFPDMTNLQAFINDPEYRAFRESRIKGSISNLHVIDDTDAAKTIPYLPKG